MKSRLEQTAMISMPLSDWDGRVVLPTAVSRTSLPLSAAKLACLAPAEILHDDALQGLGLGNTVVASGEALAERLPPRGGAGRCIV